jgi:hypothetical protein
MVSRTSLVAAAISVAGTFVVSLSLMAIPEGGSLPPVPQAADRCAQIWEDVNASHRRLQDVLDRREQVQASLTQDADLLANERDMRFGLEAYAAAVQSALREISRQIPPSDASRAWSQQYREALTPILALTGTVGHEASDLESQVSVERTSSDALDEAVNSERRLFDHYVSERDQCQEGLLSLNGNPSPPTIEQRTAVSR